MQSLIYLARLTALMVLSVYDVWAAVVLREAACHG